MRINKIAAASALAVVTSGSLLAASAIPAVAASLSPNATIAGFATVTPHSGLVQGQTVSISVTGFPAADASGTMYVFECAYQALSTQDENYCDVAPADSNNTDSFDATLTGGKATGTATFTILTGSNFKPMNTAGKCEFNPTPSAISNNCFVVVSDSQDPDTSTVSPGAITFADSRAKSYVAIKAPKTAKAGKTLKFKVGVASATTTPTGKVTITDGKTKLEKVKVPSNGIITVKEKKAKKGKHKLAAKYAGSGAFQASSAKATVKVK